MYWTLVDNFEVSLLIQSGHFTYLCRVLYFIEIKNDRPPCLQDCRAVPPAPTCSTRAGKQLASTRCIADDADLATSRKALIIKRICISGSASSSLQYLSFCVLV